MNKTNIEWVKNPDGTQGYTWNPITGCLNHTPEGLCLGGMFPCYAYKLANGRLKQRYLSNQNIAPTGNPVERGSARSDPFYPRFWAKRLYIDWSDKPKGIFVCDMGELFGDWIPPVWQEDMFRIIKLHQEHRFYLLTKQPQNLIKLSPFPENCWAGVTATDTRMALEACLKLGDIEAKVKYLSIEPMLNPINLPTKLLKVCNIDLVIIGACTGRMNDLLPLHHKTNLAMIKQGNKWTLQPQIDWVEEIVRACDEAGIPVFLKDNLYPLLGLGNGKSICHNNEVGTLRQEMPDA